MSAYRHDGAALMITEAKKFVCAHNMDNALLWFNVCIILQKINYLPNPE